jgi:hypothetical protein
VGLLQALLELISLHISLVRLDQRASRPGSQVAECRSQRLLILTFALLKTFLCTTGCHLSAWDPLQATLFLPSSSQALEVILSLFLGVKGQVLQSPRLMLNGPHPLNDKQLE